MARVLLRHQNKWDFTCELSADKLRPISRLSRNEENIFTHKLVWRREGNEKSYLYQRQPDTQIVHKYLNKQKKNWKMSLLYSNDVVLARFLAFALPFFSLFWLSMRIIFHIGTNLASGWMLQYCLWMKVPPAALMINYGSLSLHAIMCQRFTNALSRIIERRFQSTVASFDLNKFRVTAPHPFASFNIRVWYWRALEMKCDICKQCSLSLADVSKSCVRHKRPECGAILMLLWQTFWHLPAISAFVNHKRRETSCSFLGRRDSKRDLKSNKI